MQRTNKFVLSTGVNTCNNCSTKKVRGKFCKGSRDITNICSKYTGNLDVGRRIGGKVLHRA